METKKINQLVRLKDLGLYKGNMKLFILPLLILLSSCESQIGKKDFVTNQDKEQQYLNYNFIKTKGFGSSSSKSSFYYEEAINSVALVKKGEETKVRFSRMDSGKYNSKIWSKAYSLSLSSTDELYEVLFQMDSIHTIKGNLFVDDSIVCYINDYYKFSDHVILFDSILTPQFYINITGHKEHSVVNYVAKFKNGIPYILDSVRQPIKFTPNDFLRVFNGYKSIKISNDDYRLVLPKLYPDLPYWMNLDSQTPLKASRKLKQ